MTALVGIYSRLGNMSPVHAVLFSARPIGGEIKCQEGETIAVEWFAFDQIPSLLSAGHKKRIEDAVAGIRGTAVLQEMRVQRLPEKVTRKELLELRDRSGLSRQEFYLQLTEKMTLKEKVEVSGSKEMP